MKKFRFRLQTLLRLREQAEKDRQKEHAQALGQVRAQESRLGEMRDQSEQSTSRQQRLMAGRVDQSQMLNWGRFVHKLRRESLAGTQLLNALEKSAEAKRVELVAASRQRRIYENLRDRQRERHVQENNRLLAAETDEIAIDVHRRKHSTD